MENHSQEGPSFPWQLPGPEAAPELHLGAPRGPPAGHLLTSNGDVISCTVKTVNIVWIWKEVLEAKKGGRAVSSQEINVFWSTQASWECNVLDGRRQNVPLQNRHVRESA